MLHSIPNTAHCTGFETRTGFAAGTLVHTQKGLMPIEEIKVGDMVLSKPENGGEQTYKKVVRTFAPCELQVLRQVGYSEAQSADVSSVARLTVTFNVPFWIEGGLGFVGKGWRPAGKFPYGLDYDGSTLELRDGNHVSGYGSVDMYVSDLPGVGWIPGDPDDLDGDGHLWDCVNHELVANNVTALEDVQNYGSEFFLKLPVYNLEVEDFHTYYVGEHGVWVHDVNIERVLT